MCFPAFEKIQDRLYCALLLTAPFSGFFRATYIDMFGVFLPGGIVFWDWGGGLLLLNSTYTQTQLLSLSI